LSSERFWISLLVLVTFAAGLAAGNLMGRASMQPSTGDPFGPYLGRLADEFELNEGQRRDLRFALAEYGEQIERLRNESMDSQELALIAAGEDCFFKIREYIIPIDRRAEFDRLLLSPSGDDPPATIDLH